jgi:hypothetical protein
MMPTGFGVLRYCAPLVLVLGLTGCFRSEAPLMDAANAEFPFVSMTLKNEDGQLSQVKRDGDVYRFIEDGKQDGAGLQIKQLGPDLYLVQLSAPTRNTEYLFARKQEGDLIIRSDCKGLDPDVLRTKGIEIVESGAAIYECNFKTLQSLVDIGTSPDIWANSTTTLKIVSIE